MYESIELGAGGGRFGDRFFAPCLETDVGSTGRDHLEVDALMDAHVVACRDAEFRRVIMCNPYPYGFVRDAGLALLEEVARVLRPAGEAVLIASSRNPCCQPKRIARAAQALLESTGQNITMTVTGVDAAQRYAGHTFRRLDGAETVPNMEIVLTLQGSDQHDG